MTIATAKVYKNFINGEWVASSTNEYYKVFNPANMEEVVGEFPLSSEEDVEKAVQGSYEAFKTWKKVPASERAKYVYTFIELLAENADRLGEALCKEQGKPLKEAVTEEIGRAHV